MDRGVRLRCQIPVSSESGGNSRRYRGPHLAHVTRDGRRERHRGAGIEEQLHPRPNVSKGPGRARVPRPSAAELPDGCRVGRRGLRLASSAIRQLSPRGETVSPSQTA